MLRVALNARFQSDPTRFQRVTRTRTAGPEPLVPTQITASEATIPPAGGTDDIIPTLAVVWRHSPVSVTLVPQVRTPILILSTSSQSRASTLPKDVILPKLKDHFESLLVQYNIPIQYTNLGAPQLPWCTLPRLLRKCRLEIVGWPEDLPLPDVTGKHNAKGIMGLTTKDARCLHEALPGISFRPMDKARGRLREESEDDTIGNRPTKKVKGKGKAPAEGEKKFRLSEVQTEASNKAVFGLPNDVVHKSLVIQATKSDDSPKDGGRVLAARRAGITLSQMVPSGENWSYRGTRDALCHLITSFAESITQKMFLFSDAYIALLRTPEDVINAMLAGDVCEFLNRHADLDTVDAVSQELLTRGRDLSIVETRGISGVEDYYSRLVTTEHRAER
ncbi:hypothetical protein BDZ89DRAFT_1181241 [Hymenopellis radicata]|nr:hypothetical protein BDZ89DRAFT_1181241 [Hymenopellis radicata]